MGKLLASTFCVLSLACGGVTVGVSAEEAEQDRQRSAAEPPDTDNDPAPEASPQVEVALERGEPEDR